MSAVQENGRRRMVRIRTRMATGILALIPLFVTALVLRFLVAAVAGIVLPFVDPALEDWPLMWRLGLSLIVVIVGVYLLGELAMNVVGRRVLDLGERLVLRLPFVKVIYSVSKQVVSAFQGRASQAFKSVVFVEFPHKGLQAVGFVTSTIVRPDGSSWNTVFVPTTPNPTTGFLQFVPSGDLVKTDYTVEEGIKMIMSLGVLAPEMTPRMRGSTATAPASGGVIEAN